MLNHIMSWDDTGSVRVMLLSSYWGNGRINWWPEVISCYFLSVLSDHSIDQFEYAFLYEFCLSRFSGCKGVEGLIHQPFIWRNFLLNPTYEVFKKILAFTDVFIYRFCSWVRRSLGILKDILLQLYSWVLTYSQALSSVLHCTTPWERLRHPFQIQSQISTVART